MINVLVLSSLFQYSKQLESGWRKQGVLHATFYWSAHYAPSPTQIFSPRYTCLSVNQK